jgi:uncharacterized membrane protein YtjA (UPF0391 family)
MLYHAIVFLVIAVVAAVFGFTGLDTELVGIARLVCGASLVVAAVAFFDSRTAHGSH